MKEVIPSKSFQLGSSLHLTKDSIMGRAANRLTKRTLVIASMITAAMVDAPSTIASECKLNSEHYSNVSISISEQKRNWRIFSGTLKYKDKALYAIESQLGNGFPAQYYTFGRINSEEKYLQREEVIGSGKIISFVGDQIARGTPKESRKPIKPIKVFFTDLARMYFYSLGEERFNPQPSSSSKEILASLEGLFIGSKNCSKNHFVYTW